MKIFRIFRTGNLEVVKPPPSDGIWPILPYIENTNSVSPSTSALKKFNVPSQKKSRLLRKKRLSRRFNLFENLGNLEILQHFCFRLVHRILEVRLFQWGRKGGVLHLI